MNRRDTIKKMILAGGGIVVGPTWMKEWHLNNLPEAIPIFTPDESALISAIVDVLLPATEDGIGGLSLGVDAFLDRLFSRCYEETEQKDIRMHLGKLDAISKSLTGRSFVECNADQQRMMFEKMAISEDEPGKDFIELIKSEAIRGFRTSREVMTKYYKYRVVPGNYQGCVDVEIQ